MIDTSIDISSIYAIEEDLTIKIDALDTDGNPVSKTTTAYMKDNIVLDSIGYGFGYYTNPYSSYKSDSGFSFNMMVDNIDYSQPVSFILEALDSNGNVISGANYISGDVYYNTDGSISSMTSNAPDYYFYNDYYNVDDDDPRNDSDISFDNTVFGSQSKSGYRITASATNKKGDFVSRVIREKNFVEVEEPTPEETITIDGFVTISNAVVNDSKQLSFYYDVGGDVDVDTSQGLEIVLSSSLGNETFYEYYSYGSVSNYDLGGIYVSNENLDIQLSYTDVNGTAGQDTATVLMPEVVEETGETANVIESFVAGFADNRYEVSLTNAEIDFTQPIQLTAYFNDYQGAVDMGFSMDEVYFDGAVVLDGTNTITSNTVNSSSYYRNIVQLETGNVDIIKQFTNTDTLIDTLIVDIVATDTNGNTITQQDSLAL
jgi:hypothetical protein